MRIRTKLVMYFAIVALLAPILGLAALNRIGAINNSVTNLTDHAIPLSNQAREMEKLLLDQQNAAISYAASGRPEERQRYLDAELQFDEALAGLTRSDTSDRGQELSKSVTDERTKLKAAGAQLAAARNTQDRNRENLRAKREEMVQELGQIRRRFIPSAQNQLDGSTVPTPLRNQVNDLLLGTEGMQRVVAQEFALATSYTITPDNATRDQFETLGSAFNNWLQLAFNAGGPDDRAILTRVQTKFFKEFEPAARSMTVASEHSSRARGVFGESSASMSAALNQIVEAEEAKMASARSDAESTASSTGTLMIILTVIAFAVAGALGIFFAGSITRPLVHLRDAADRVSRGDVDGVEIDVNTKDEVGDLAGAFRRMVASVRFLMASNADDEFGPSGYPSPAGD